MNRESSPVCERPGLAQQASAGGAGVVLRATVVQHQDRKQPSQPTRPTKEMPITNDIATNQRHQRRAENVDTKVLTQRSQRKVGAISSVGERFLDTEEATGSIPVSPT
jgi:hypothetical protein